MLLIAAGGAWMYRRFKRAKVAQLKLQLDAEKAGTATEEAKAEQEGSQPSDRGHEHDELETAAPREGSKSGAGRVAPRLKIPIESVDHPFNQAGIASGRSGGSGSGLGSHRQLSGRFGSDRQTRFGTARRTGLDAAFDGRTTSFNLRQGDGGEDSQPSMVLSSDSLDVLGWVQKLSGGITSISENMSSPKGPPAAFRWVDGLVDMFSPNTTARTSVKDLISTHQQETHREMPPNSTTADTAVMSSRSPGSTFRSEHSGTAGSAAPSQRSYRLAYAAGGPATASDDDAASRSAPIVRPHPVVVDPDDQPPDGQQSTAPAVFSSSTMQPPSAAAGETGGWLTDRFTNLISSLTPKAPQRGDATAEQTPVVNSISSSELFARADRDGSGVLDYDEFLDLLRATAESGQNGGAPDASAGDTPGRPMEEDSPFVRPMTTPEEPTIRQARIYSRGEEEDSEQGAALPPPVELPPPVQAPSSPSPSSPFPSWLPERAAIEAVKAMQRRPPRTQNELDARIAALRSAGAARSEAMLRQSTSPESVERDEAAEEEEELPMEQQHEESGMEEPSRDEPAPSQVAAPPSEAPAPAPTPSQQSSSTVSLPADEGVSSLAQQVAARAEARISRLEARAVEARAAEAVLRLAAQAAAADAKAEAAEAKAATPPKTSQQEKPSLAQQVAARAEARRTRMEAHAQARAAERSAAQVASPAPSPEKAPAPSPGARRGSQSPRFIALMRSQAQAQLQAQARGDASPMTRR